MALLICAPTARELAALVPGRLPPPDRIPQMRPIRLPLRDCEGVFMVTGTGPLNAGLALGFCLGLTLETRPQIDAMLYAGLGAAYDLYANPLCSLWRINEEIWPEYGLNDGVSVTARAFSVPLWISENGQTIYERLELAPVTAIRPAMKEEPWPVCASITVAGISASFARREKLWNTWHAALENMEGFAAAYAALRVHIPCVEIRSVAHKVGPRKPEEKDVDGATRALASILPTLNLV